MLRLVDPRAAVALAGVRTEPSGQECLHSLCDDAGSPRAELAARATDPGAALLPAPEAEGGTADAACATAQPGAEARDETNPGRKAGWRSGRAACGVGGVLSHCGGP